MKTTLQRVNIILSCLVMLCGACLIEGCTFIKYDYSRSYFIGDVDATNSPLNIEKPDSTESAGSPNVDDRDDVDGTVKVK